MISHIHIRDFAIIDELSLDLHEGFNVITGETGAGKSIIIEAISLALGSRADTTFVRSGKEKATIEIVVDLDHPELLPLLEENGLSAEEQLIIRREISAAGKSICRIGGDIVSVSFLNKLCRKIADIHGQYDHQSLLDSEHHIELLDLYDEKHIGPVKKQVSLLFHKYTDIRRRLTAIEKNEAEAQRRLDFLSFQLQEISEAALLPDEDDALSQQIRLLQNSEKIYKGLSEAYNSLYDGVPSLLDQMGHNLRILEEIADFSPDIQSFSNTFSDSYYKLEDLSSEIRRFRDGISFSDEELNSAIERFDFIEELKRKYGGSIESILAYKEELTESLEKIENIDQHKEQLRLQLKSCKADLSAACWELTRLREKSAKNIEKKINHELLELNFKDAALTVSFKKLGSEGGETFSENGIDVVEFMITTNKGETPKPLSKIASGGEISRIMLAFKYIIGDLDRIPTMIFDEIDSGISGITASVVGKKLLQISEKHQILCITHLPQIAAFGDHHYGIRKITEKTSTHTTVVPLSDDEKVQEIARLLGGINITETTLKNARELLAFSKSDAT